YLTNGFRNAQVEAILQDDCRGKNGDICVDLHIEEGAQTLVQALTIEGNQSFSSDQIRELVSATEGQPYSEFNVSGDRESVASFYFNRGFPDIKLEAFADPD